MNVDDLGRPPAACFRRGAWIASAASAVAMGATASRLAAQTPDAMKIGVGQIESHAEGHYALDAGFFAKRGLSVEVQSLRNGATIAAAVASGDLQAGCSTVLQLAQARGRGLPFVILAAGSLHDSRFGDTAGLVVAASSPYHAPKDLNGKVIALSTLNGLDQLETSMLVDKDGGDSSTLKFVELSERIMADALEQGRVDGASLEEPELSEAGKRIRSVGDGMNAISKRFISTVYFTTADWLAANPGIARRFSEAIFAAGAWAMANPASAAVILQKDVGASMRATQRFATRNDVNELAPLARAAVQYKFAAPSGLDILRDIRF
jgi:NitT/TauT family transport system substrate-binding protein